MALNQPSLAPSPHVRLVASFNELVTTPFTGRINALCWPRQLSGDFQEVLERLKPGDGITSLQAADLRRLDLSAAGTIARDVLLSDQQLLSDHGLQPALDCISRYTRDAASGPIATDVHSFHVDRAPVPADTYLCTYAGATSEAIDNDQAVRRVDIPETRAELLDLHGGADDEDFAAFLSEHSYDLHYAPRPGAKPYVFGLGNMWRVAIAYPGCPVAPCIHRAPLTEPGAPARLLMIS